MKGFSDPVYQWQNFWIAHKLQFRQWRVILVISAEALVLVYTLLMLLLFFAGSAQVNKTLARTGDRLAATAGLRARAPQPLVFGAAVVTPLASDKADIFIRATNPNQRWFLRSMTYRLHLGDKLTDTHEVGIMPEGDRYLFALSETMADPGSISPSQISVEVVHADWRYLTDLTVLAQAKFQTKSPLFSSISAGAAQATRFTADFQTTGVFTFKTLALQIVVLDNSKPIAIAIQTINNLSPAVPAKLEATWKSALTTRAQAQVLPFLDLTDPALVVTR